MGIFIFCHARAFNRSGSYKVIFVDELKVYISAGILCPFSHLSDSQFHYDLLSSNS